MENSEIIWTGSPDDQTGIEQERQAALKKAESEYFDRSSPNYRDNERFRWAVETINKHFSEAKTACEKAYREHL